MLAILLPLVDPEKNKLLLSCRHGKTNFEVNDNNLLGFSHYVVVKGKVNIDK